MIARIMIAGVTAAVVAGFLAASAARLHAQQGAVAIDSDDIGGVVSGASGPEAGAWVIAETRHLPTRFVRIVVTDDQGRYVIPDLPQANYDVWVRGYGLVDSPQMKWDPGSGVTRSDESRGGKEWVGKCEARVWRA